MIVYIPNAFIQIENPKKVGYQIDMMKIRGKLAQIQVEIPKEDLGPYITNKNGKAVLYL